MVWQTILHLHSDVKVQHELQQVHQKYDKSMHCGRILPGALWGDDELVHCGKGLPAVVSTCTDEISVIIIKSDISNMSRVSFVLLILGLEERMVQNVNDCIIINGIVRFVIEQASKLTSKYYCLSVPYKGQ